MKLRIPSCSLFNSYGWFCLLAEYSHPSPHPFPPTQVLHTTYVWLECYCQGPPRLFWALKWRWCWLTDSEWPHFAWSPLCRVWAESRLSTRVSNSCLLSGHRDDLTMELLSAAKTESAGSWGPKLRHLGNVHTDLRIMVCVYTKVRQLLKKKKKRCRIYEYWDVIQD